MTTAVARLCDETDPDCVIVDHVSFASTLAMYAVDRPFVTLVPGHPSQLPVGSERYGVPVTWPLRLRPDPQELIELHETADRVTECFTISWNTALAAVAPGRPPVDDAFRVHGNAVLYNSVARSTRRPGPLNSRRIITSSGRSFAAKNSHPNWACGRPTATAAHRSMSPSGPFYPTAATSWPGSPTRCGIWTCGRPSRPAPHRSNGSAEFPTTGSLLPACRRWPCSTMPISPCTTAATTVSKSPWRPESDRSCCRSRPTEFSNASDLEQTGAASVLAPNDATAADLAQAIDARLGASRPAAIDPVTNDALVDAAFRVSALRGDTDAG